MENKVKILMKQVIFKQKKGIKQEKFKFQFLKDQI